jgi:excisionase family DNA binding protein
MAMEQRELVVTPEDGVQTEPQDFEPSMNQLREELQVIQGGKAKRPSAPKLLLPDGEQLDLPPHVFNALAFVVHHMAQGDAISLMPMDKLLTTRQAADILSMSRPFLTGLLDRGDILSFKVGTHRRVKMQDVLNYKKQRDEKALRMLDQMAEEAQEAGDYFG